MLDAIALENLRCDWDTSAFEQADFTEGEPLYLVAHEVVLGQLDMLEPFCREAGLSYIRWAGGCAGAFCAERVISTGEGEPRSFGVGEEDEFILTLDAIRRSGSIEAIEAHFDGAERRPVPLYLTDDPPAAI